MKLALIPKYPSLLSIVTVGEGSYQTLPGKICALTFTVEFTEESKSYRCFHKTVSGA